MRSIIIVNHGFAALALGRVTDARSIFEQAVNKSAVEEWQLVRLIATSLLATSHAALGHLRHAAHLYQQVVREGPADNPPIRGLAHARGGLGDVLREWNELDTALEHLRVAADLQRYMGGLTTTAVAIYLPLARVYLAQGRVDDALETLDRLEAVAHQASAPLTLALTATWRARVALSQGDIMTAERWSRARGLHIEGPLPSDDDVARDQAAYATLVRLAIAQQRAQEALPLLDHLRAQALASGQTPRRIEALILRALALEDIGQRAEALSALREALHMAEPEGYVRLYVDEGRPVATLLNRLQRSSQDPNVYCDRLLAALDHAVTVPTSLNAHSRGNTTTDLHHDALLSEREREVLRMVAAGVSNAEIARQLVIEVSTVKRHVSNILAKLGAANRTEAAARARSMDLL
jgi:LuxR family maltose regulon positive regulatory protein